MRMHTLQVDQWRMWTKVHMVTKWWIKHRVYVHVSPSGFPLFYWKKIQDFPGPQENFPGPLRSPQMLTYKEKWGKTFTHTVQSMGMGKRCPPPQPTRGSGGASLAPPAPKTVLVHFRRLQKTHLMASNLAFFHDFPGPWASISRTFQDQSDFPGLSRSWIFQEKNPALSRTFQEAWEPWKEHGSSNTHQMQLYTRDTFTHAAVLDMPPESMYWLFLYWIGLSRV